MCNFNDLLQIQDPILAAKKFNPAWSQRDQDRWVIHRIARMFTERAYNNWWKGLKYVQNDNTRRRDSEYLGDEGYILSTTYTTASGHKRNDQCIQEQLKSWACILKCETPVSFIDVLGTGSVMKREARYAADGEMLQAGSMAEWNAINRALELIHSEIDGSQKGKNAFNRLWREYLGPQSSKWSAARSIDRSFQSWE